MMSTPKSVNKLSKFLHYVLGCRPDEFGLIPDADGYVPVKELLKTLAEEEGWRHVRWSHLNEVVLTAVSPSIEIDADHIRAVARDRLPQPVPAEDLPKLLYACVRPRAQPVIMRHGLTPSRFPQVVLASDRVMAERIGKRSHPSPVMLTVNVAEAISQGAELSQFGDGLYLADRIPRGSISGPPLPKEAAEPKQPTAPLKPPPKHPGSFILGEDRPEGPRSKDGRGKKRKGKDADWKKDRKRIRREKERFW